MKPKINPLLRRVNKLNTLLLLATKTYSETWDLDYKDSTCEFCDELRELMEASECLEKRISLEIEKTRALIKEAI